MSMWQKIYNHPWTTSFSNWLLVMAIYTISRLFFYWVNLDIYPDITVAHLCEMLGGGVRFDMTALLYLNSVYFLLMLLPLPWKLRNHPRYQNIAYGFYLVPNIIGILANCIDTVYVRFSDRRTTLAFFSEFANDNNLGSILWTSLFQYWYVSIFTIVVITLLVVLSRRSRAIYPDRRKPWMYYLSETIILCISVYFIIIGIRGGFGSYTRPITLSNALQYTNRPCETNIVLNTPFALMRSSEAKAYIHPHYYSDEEISSIYQPIHLADSASITTNKCNIVILILESFSKEYFGYYNHDLDNGQYEGYTPFLDSLLHYSVTYPLSLSSGRKSIDAMPSVLAGIPRFGAPYVLTPYSTNDITSIANCLNSEGYQTAFFHGAPNGSMGFLAFSRSCGFGRYYGKDEYNNDADYDGCWAIWDEEFLQYYAHEMSRLNEPFMTAMFTASSHHPFRIPERYANRFPRGTEPLHHCIQYTDNALRLFFATAKQQDWYSNTLFVITADHTNILTYPEYTNDKGVYEVPLIFYHPSWSKEERDSMGNKNQDMPVCQADIMSSVLAYIGYDKDYLSFGDDILTKRKEHPYVVNYNEPLYQCFSHHLLVQYDGQKIVHIFDFKQDRLLQNDLVDSMINDDEVQDMLRYMKAYIQQYIVRMISNQMTLDKSH